MFFIVFSKPTDPRKAAGGAARQWRGNFICSVNSERLRVIVIVVDVAVFQGGKFSIPH